MLTLLLTSMLTLAFNIQPAKAASETIIDTHGDSRFTKYPSGPYWWSVADHDVFHTRAYNNNFWYTYCGVPGEDPLYWGSWYVLISGEYEVFVWIPDPDPFGGYTPTHSAKYTVYHQGGYTEKTVNQALRLGGWYSLGTFTFGTDAWITLTDRTGEPYLSTMIAFDAIKFVPTSPINQPFTLNNGYVSPSSGDTSTTFSYYVTYSDPEGDVPTLKYVYIDGSPHPMAKISGDYVSGAVFRYSTTLSVGLDHNYYFHFEDSVHGHTKSLPPSGTYPGPNVPPPPEYRTLTVYSSPSGVSFTANGVSHSTPWSGTYSQDTSVNLVMPSVYSAGDVRYYWHEWSDGEPSSSRTIILNADTTVTGTYIGPYYELIVASSPISGIPFTIDGASKTTTYSEWLYQGYYTIEMPTTYNGYTWQHWLEDGNTNRIRTVSLTYSVMLTAVYSAPPNQPPVALFTYSPGSPVHSGDIVSFDASSSYDPEGGTISYEWDFGDGETATDYKVSHRFRGAMIDPETLAPKTKDYIITLTVRDDKGAIDTESASLTVEPLRKTVDVGPGYLGVSCWMEAVYNWVGTDEATGENLYIISRIDTYSGGISGAYQLFILRRISPPPSMPKLIWHIPLPTMPLLKTYATPFTPSLWQKLWGTTCEVTTLTFPDGTFEGIGVTDTSLMLIVATGTETGITLYYDAGLTKFEPSSPIVRLKPEELKELWELRDIMDLLNKIIGIIGSPCEIRIYDSEGRVTGLVNGEIKEEIPGSAYANGTILILYPNETYRYEVVGIDKGTYRLLVMSVENVNATTFTAIEIPTASNSIHQYIVDWDALSLGEEGVTVQVDSDGDGVFEHTFASDSELTQSEFLAQMALYTFSIVWGAETFIVSVESNSTVGNFAFSQPDTEISFDVSGLVDTIGFCNVTIPKALLYGEPWTVLIDGAPVPLTMTENATHSCLYFTYAHSTHTIQIIGTWVISPPSTYTLTITTTVGGTTNPPPGTYTYTANASVQVTAIPNADYTFDHWELDTVNVGSANPYTVLMDNNHTLKAVFTYSPPPPSLSAPISPLSASVNVGQSVTFTSTVSGGYTPYGYQWYLNGAPVSGATSASWMFTPTTSGIYYVQLKVTDAKDNTAQSDTAHITVAPPAPVGGYSISIQLPTTAKPVTIHIALLMILTALFIKIKRKAKRKTLRTTLP